ncbi:MAG: 1-acyl-sn-glycerol-3-phosphate acyltransferase [Jiangellales bacterium]
MRGRASRALVYAAGFTVTGEPPDVPVYVAVAAPHTSNWDFPAMITMAWASEVTPVWLGKQEMFAGALGPLMHRLGGIAVDRDNPVGLVDEVAHMVKTAERVAVVIPPEGTRRGGKYWKSGFHRIASAAGVPIVLTYLDGPSRTGGWGPSFMPSGQITDDMDVVRAFYADKRGLRPARKTEPLLRSEATAATTRTQAQ